VKRETFAPALQGQVIKLAILAVGGQGGGVLTNWIVALAESQGYWAQSTSVAGVAQRTGATIYYVEMAPRDPARPDRAPVFALSPAPGDVDVLIAAELAEAGRAILRGFVTDRTTLIASTHRMLAVAEKVVPGDGRADAATVLDHARSTAGRLVALDMEAAAQAAGAHVSAALFGALAASGALPFPRAAFEATIRGAGRGVEASLTAFAAAHDRAMAPDAAELPAPAPEPGPPAPSGPAPLLAEWQSLAARAAALPAPAAAMAAHGLAKVVDFLDPAYGREYLDRLDRAVATGDAGFASAAAKHLANAMAYDDLPRVADLKLRAARTARIRAEAGATEAEPVHVTEYFHPRMAEAAATLPAGLGAWLTARPRLMAALDRVVDRGRRIRSDRIGGVLLLSALAALRPHRRRLLRHRSETAHLDAWFDLALATHAGDPALATEVLNARRLIKGYADTHARGLSKYDRVLATLPLLAGRPDAADWLRRLIAAALQDPDGKALDGAIRTVASFAPTPS
jgi:indolepyruvate ferredoxin oxidoreductase beta subunit